MLRGLFLLVSGLLQIEHYKNYRFIHSAERRSNFAIAKYTTNERVDFHIFGQIKCVWCDEQVRPKISEHGGWRHVVF